MSHFYGPWKRTHWLLVRIGFPALYRSRYASPMIGGGWDGFEWSRE